MCEERVGTCTIYVCVKYSVSFSSPFMFSPCSFTSQSSERGRKEDDKEWDGMKEREEEKDEMRIIPFDDKSGLNVALHGR